MGKILSWNDDIGVFITYPTLDHKLRKWSYLEKKANNGTNHDRFFLPSIDSTYWYKSCLKSFLWPADVSSSDKHETLITLSIQKADIFSFTFCSNGGIIFHVKHIPSNIKRLFILMEGWFHILLNYSFKPQESSHPYPKKGQSFSLYTWVNISARVNKNKINESQT